MRGLFLSIALALASMPLGGFTVLAQEGELWVDEAWKGVTIEVGAAPMEPLNEFLGTDGSLRGRITRGHLVTFTNPDEAQSPEKVHAHIPEVPNAEFMAVYVHQGEFALDIMPPTSFVVDPAGNRTISRLTDSGDEFEAYYSLGETSPEALLNEEGAPCTEMCTVPPPQADGQMVEQDERTAIQLLPGDWVIAPAGGQCVWCLLNTWAETGPTGVLYVYPLADGDFSWSAAASAVATPTMREAPAAEAIVALESTAGADDALTTIAAWGFFNPAPNCRSG